jgi:hypothetical protein
MVFHRAPAKLELTGRQEMMGKGDGALTLEIVRQVIDADREDAQRGEKCRRRCREMRSASFEHIDLGARATGEALQLRLRIDGHAVIIESKPFQKNFASVRASARNSSSRPVPVTNRSIIR